MVAASIMYSCKLIQFFGLPETKHLSMMKKHRAFLHGKHDAELRTEQIAMLCMYFMVLHSV